MTTEPSLTPEQRGAALLAEVQRRTGISTQDEASHVLDAVVDALGELLTGDEARAVAPHLGARLSRLLEAGAGRHSASSDVAALVDGVAWRENVAEGVALEHATAVCDAIMQALPAEARTKLQRDLPKEVIAFLERGRADGIVHRREPPKPEVLTHSLAQGRPGGAHPVSESKPVTAHSESVALTDNPHADRKISSAGTEEPPRSR